MSHQRKGPAGKQRRTILGSRRLPPPRDVIVAIGANDYGKTGWSGPVGPVPTRRQAVRYTMKEARAHANHLRGLNWYPNAVPEKLKGGR